MIFCEKYLNIVVDFSKVSVNTLTVDSFARLDKLYMGLVFYKGLLLVI